MNSELTLSVVQSVNQYVIGSLVGTVCDEFFDKIEVDDSQYLMLILKSLGQTAMNGILIKYSLEFLHGNPPETGYHDPTGGYMYLFGLYDSQPRFRALNKKLFLGTRMFINSRLESRLKEPTSPANADNSLLLDPSGSTRDSDQPGNLTMNELGL